MKSTLSTLLRFIIILPLIIPYSTHLAIAKAAAWQTDRVSQPTTAGNNLAEDTNHNLDQAIKNHPLPNLIANQQAGSLPIYTATVLLEDVGGSTTELLTAYDGVTNTIETAFGSFYVMKEDDTYYLWVGNRMRTGTASNTTSIEQRFESQDGLIWHNRTDTNLTKQGVANKYVEGLRHVIKTGNNYEGWEQYFYELSWGWSFAIRYITSTNGISWTVANEPALSGVANVNVIKDGATYQMWAYPYGDSSYAGNRSMRYRTSNQGGDGWGDWQTGGSLVNLDGGGEVKEKGRIRQLTDGTYQLFYRDGDYINLATSPDGLNFTTQVVGILDILEVLGITDINFLTDFAVVEVEGEDWFYFTYCETLNVSGFCQKSRIVVSRPMGADLEITKSVTPAIVAPGDPLTYTLSFSNTGQITATGVMITDIVPAELIDLNVLSSGVAITDTGYQPEYVWSVQDLVPGAKGIITVTGRADPTLGNRPGFKDVTANINQAGTPGGDLNFTNTTTIASLTFETDPTNNEAQARVTAITPALLLDKTVTPGANVTYHGPVTYTLTLSNSSEVHANKVLLTDTLPISTTFARWVAQPAGANLAGHQITWSGAVPANQAVNFTFVVSHTGSYSDVVANTVEYSYLGHSGTDQASFSVAAAPPSGNPPGRVYLPIVLKTVKE